MQSHEPIRNECDDDCFVHRVYSLPLVAAACDVVADKYASAKNNGPETVKAGIAAGEAYVHDVSTKVAPFYEKYLFTVVCLMSKVACAGLNVVERFVPAIKSTPRDVKKAVSSVYDGSRVQSGVQTVQMWQSKAASKVSNGRQYFLQLIDTMNDLCNRYIAIPSEAAVKTTFPASMSIRERLVSLVGKVYRGLTHKASNVIDFAASYYVAGVQRMSSARDYAMDSYVTAKSYASSAIALPSTLTLRCARSVSALFTELSTRALHMSPSALKPALQTSNDAIVSANVAVQEADSVTGLTYDAWSTAVDKYPVLGKIVGAKSEAEKKLQ